MSGCQTNLSPSDMIEEQLEAKGYSPEEVREIMMIVDAARTELSRDATSTVLRRILIRLDRDSVAGRALARALGFTSEKSLAGAAEAFGVSKQYLHHLESNLRAQLRDL